jgi:uncharacterized RDD family membrane protein YckC
MIGNTSDPNTDLLQDLEQGWQYEDASTGLRFTNYMIDLICFYAIIFGLFFLIVFVTRSEAILYWLDSIPSLLDRLLSLVMYGLVMSLIEGLFKGRTIGKLITGTKAISEDGTEISWGQAFARGFSRIVPFEPFSALGGNPWHDRWSKTRVVKIR